MGQKLKLWILGVFRTLETLKILAAAAHCSPAGASGQQFRKTGSKTTVPRAGAKFNIEGLRLVGMVRRSDWCHGAAGGWQHRCTGNVARRQIGCRICARHRAGGDDCPRLCHIIGLPSFSKPLHPAPLFVHGDSVGFRGAES